MGVFSDLDNILFSFKEKTTKKTKWLMLLRILCYRRINLNYIILKKEKEKKQKWFDNEEGLTPYQIKLGIVFTVIMACISFAYNYYVYCDVWFYFKEPWC